MTDSIGFKGDLQSLGSPHYNITNFNFDVDLLQEFLFILSVVNTKLISEFNQYTVKIKKFVEFSLNCRSRDKNNNIFYLLKVKSLDTNEKTFFLEHT
jgi:hypothetical protein